MPGNARLRALAATRLIDSPRKPQVSQLRFFAGGMIAALLAAALLTGCGRQQPPASPAASEPASGTEPRVLFTEKPRAEPTVILTHADADRAVGLEQGQVVEVRLPTDRASGYTWIPAQGMAPVMHPDGVPQYEADEAAGADGPGTEIWRFIGGEPGHAHVVFDYRRPLGGDAPPQQSLTFHFDVQ